MIDVARARAVWRHALAVAAQADDWRDRELGPIHLLKYLYLADMAYAASHDGESFSGVAWRFHKFGPWAVEAFAQIEPATVAIHARRRQFASPYAEDHVRWSLRSDEIESAGADLPPEVARVVAKAVRTFGADTSALLHHVYRTPPMLSAAPGDQLDLSAVLRASEEKAAHGRLPEAHVSKTKLKKMREEMGRRLATRKQARRTVIPDPPPRYDEVFARGVAWLDGPEPEPQSRRVVFSDDVWTSRARGDGDLS